MPFSYRNMHRNVILRQIMRKSLWSILKVALVSVLENIQFVFVDFNIIIKS